MCYLVEMRSSHEKFVFGARVTTVEEVATGVLVEHGNGIIHLSKSGCGQVCRVDCIGMAGECEALLTCILK